MRILREIDTKAPNEEFQFAAGYRTFDGLLRHLERIDDEGSFVKFLPSFWRSVLGFELASHMLHNGHFIPSLDFVLFNTNFVARLAPYRD